MSHKDLMSLFRMLLSRRRALRDEIQDLSKKVKEVQRLRDNASESAESDDVQESTRQQAAEIAEQIRSRTAEHRASLYNNNEALVRQRYSAHRVTSPQRLAQQRRQTNTQSELKHLIELLDLPMPGLDDITALEEWHMARLLFGQAEEIASDAAMRPNVGVIAPVNIRIKRLRHRRGMHH